MRRLRSSPLTLTVRNDLAEIGRIAPLIEEFCAGRSLGADIAHAINLSLDELLANTISYGYDDGEAHAIDITLAAAGNAVIVTIRDDAQPFDPTEAPPPDLDSPL